MAGSQRDRVLDTQVVSVLDALALVRARLRRDEEGVSVLLDHCDNRACASLLADMLSYIVRVTPDPEATLDGLHEAMIRGAADV